MCIISIRLKEDKIGSRGIANYMKLIDVVVRKGWRPEEAVKTGFRSADLHYSEIERVNKIFKEMAKNRWYRVQYLGQKPRSVGCSKTGMIKSYI